jgi:hypothetical protein
MDDRVTLPIERAYPLQRLTASGAADRAPEQRLRCIGLEAGEGKQAGGGG